MKQIFSIILTLFFFPLTISLFADQPSPTKAVGRLLKVKELFTIVDDADRYLFQYPHTVKVSPSGDMFVLDKRQLLKFDAVGNFQRNFHKHGRGPKEVVGVTNYLISGNQLIIHDSGQNKILIFDHQNGQMLREFRLRTPHIDRLFFCHENSFFLMRREVPETQGKGITTDIPVRLIRVDSTGEHFTECFQFPQKHFFIKHGDRMNFFSLHVLLHCPVGNDDMFIVNTDEYSIKHYSFKENKIIRTIGRDYPRIKLTDENKKYVAGGAMRHISVDGINFFDPPLPDYISDIEEIMVRKDRLWVFTSTIKKQNDTEFVLVDVFDFTGQYRDHFYYPCPPGNNPLTLSSWLFNAEGNCLYTKEHDKDGNYILKKYEITD